MARFQSGITAEASKDALFITMNIRAGAEASVRQALAHGYATVSELQTRFESHKPHVVVGIGSDAWDKLYQQRPAHLLPFPSINSRFKMPSTPVDLVFHVRADQHDVCFIMARALFALVKPYVELVEQVHGFRYLDSRDTTGFVDGTENPQGDDRLTVALVGQEDPAFEGGSYLHLQRYIHKFDAWATQSKKQREDTYGRTEDDNIEYASADKPLSAHTKRTSLKDAEGNSLEILRQSLPYGGVDEAGLMFASYCRTPDHFNQMLISMAEGDGAGHTDRMLQFTQAMTGSAFFVPAWDFFEQSV